MPGTEQVALWSAIRANPDDDTPRLVYADWLQENGDEDRAEFIRVQCALAASPRTKAKERQALEVKEQRLHKLHREKWLEPFRKLFRSAKKWHPTDLWFTRFVFRRGFVSTEALGSAPLKLLTQSRDTLEPIAIETAVIPQSEYHINLLKALARWCGATTITSLSFGNARDSDIESIIAGKKLCRLRVLGLGLGTVSDVGVAALAAWPFAISLRDVSLRYNSITHKGACVLADSPYLTSIVRLNLSGNRIGPDGANRLRKRFGDKLVIERPRTE